MTLTKASWPEYRDCPELRKKWEAMKNIHDYTPYTTDVDPEVFYPLIFAKPIFRTLMTYGAQGGAGMSLFGLAALTRHTPREVWKQVQKESINEGDICGTTNLLVIYSYRPYSDFLLHGDVIPASAYSSMSEDYDFYAEEYGLPSFEQMFKLYPLSKCTVRFNPHEANVHHFSPSDIRDLRKTFTLGLSRKEANAYKL